MLDNHEKVTTIQNFVTGYCGNNWDSAIAHLCLEDENELSDFLSGDIQIPSLAIRVITLLEGEKQLEEQTNKDHDQAEITSLHTAMIAQKLEIENYVALKNEADLALKQIIQGTQK